MNHSKLFKFDKKNYETQFIVFVSKALKKVDRKLSMHQQPLNMIYCDGKRIIATDGHRMHMYTPDECPLPKGLYTVEKRTKTEIHISCRDTGNNELAHYPKVDKVLPDIKNIKDFKSTNSNIKLAEILREMGSGSISLNFFNDAISIPDIASFNVVNESMPIAMYGKRVMSVIMTMR